MLNLPLSESTFRDIRDYIYEKSGIYISDTKKYLIENRLSRIIRENKLNSFEDYLKLIKQSRNGNDLNRLFDAVTTNETYFFREPRQLNVCVEGIMPRILAQKKGAKNVRIWSAACSTGEEPYTISLMLMEKGYLQKQFEIYGSDLSEGVLDSAKQAVYNSYSIRNLPEPYLKKYFSNSGQSYTLSSSVKNTVKFMKVNLIEDKNIKQLRGMDIIFCRNVLIYFDTRAKQRAVSNLYDSLNPGGYLFIGSSESLHSVTRALRPNVVDKVIMYQKV
ncbi:MAG TPA: protein-glutamate O-methyltransferase CheR [Nitrospirae bacterium]|nr:chemotaxis protein methyltransferase Cher2 [bacterium BMS3Abin06]HDH13217.1 protein-glutamate O-methyltransferase CheR [Nitrospirota bacterium]HDZ01815.1 protein-glutamate O-methyltransferase CheR [Nitrospirota bacterium]